MKLRLALCTSLALLFGSSQACARPYTDDLSKCLVSSTTDADKALLMKWMFAAISLNKQVSGYVNMSPEVRKQINTETAALYTELITARCKAQTRDAYKYEGEESIGSAFKLLGSVAAQGMFTDPAVQAGMAEMTNLFDEKKFKEVFESK